MGEQPVQGCPLPRTGVPRTGKGYPQIGQGYPTPDRTGVPHPRQDRECPLERIASDDSPRTVSGVGNIVSCIKDMRSTHARRRKKKKNHVTLQMAASR